MRKRMVLRVIGIIIMVLLFIFTVFLGCTAMIFYFEGNSGAPDLFGYNIYLVRENNFYQLNAGTAAIATHTYPDEIRAGEIIIYKRYENSGVQLGLVNSATLKEAVMSYDIETEEGDNITISQGQYVARVSFCSDFIGGFIDFALSPFGVVTIAVLPCLGIAVFEIVRFIFSKLPSPRIETVMIQEETPTFIPKKQREEQQRRLKSSAKKAAEVLSDKPEPPARAIPASYKSAAENTARRSDIPQRSLNSAGKGTEEAAAKARANAAKVPISLSEPYKNPRNVQDRIEFSQKAQREIAKSHTAADTASASPIDTADKPRTERKPPELSLDALMSKSRNSASSADNHGNSYENKPPASNPRATKLPQGDEPDLSMVISDNEDKRYNIDDILADIEKRRK